MDGKVKVKLFYRQKVLLALLQTFGGKLTNVNLQKYLFLFTQLCQKERSYEFVPYKFGCFSFQSYADRRRLIEVGALMQEDGWSIVPERDYMPMLNDSDLHKMELFKEKYGKIKGNDLVQEVYREFPYYAINSEIASKLMSAEEMLEIEAQRPNASEHCFFTIGYEGSTFENYLNRLIRNNIHTLVDVRRNPLSRKYGFSRSTLSETLSKLGIDYLHMPELGIASEKRKNLESRQDYTRLFNEYEATVLKDNEQALYKLLGIVEKQKRVAITCFELESCMCHRGRVAKAMEALPSWKYEIRHI